MDFPSTQFVPSRIMGTYQPIHQIGMWGENFKSIGNPSISASVIVEVDNKLENESETASHEMPVPSCKHDQEASKPFDKIQRRLAQNREAARKSRLRKKAYVQQLESSRLKLIQLEKELEQAREQGLYIGGGLEAGHLGFSGVVNPGDDHIELEKLKKGLAEQFEIKDLGALKYFFGMEFSRSKEGIFVSQCKYTLDLLKETGLLGCKAAETPFEPNLKLEHVEGENVVNVDKFQRLVGRLLYLSHTLPDITFAVSKSVHALNRTRSF